MLGKMFSLSTALYLLYKVTVICSQSTVDQCDRARYHRYCTAGQGCSFTVTIPECGKCHDDNDQQNDVVTILSRQIQQQNELIEQQTATIQELLQSVQRLNGQNECDSQGTDSPTEYNPGAFNITGATDCDDIQNKVGPISGVYQIQPERGLNTRKVLETLKENTGSATILSIT